MLYNIKLQKAQKSVDCQTCEYFDKKKKKCLGLYIRCFEQDKMGNLKDRSGLIIKKENKL